VKALYEDICKLAVLSGIEIDKAKRAFDDVDVGTEIKAISNVKEYKAYKTDGAAKGPVKPVYPEFFKEVGNGVELSYKKADKQGANQEDKKAGKQERKYVFYHAPMEYVYKSAGDIDFRQGRVGRQEYQPISEMIVKPKGSVSTVYDHKKRIIKICENYKIKLNGEYIKLRNAKDDDEKELIYQKIKQLKSDRNAEVAEELTEKLVLYLVIKELDNGKKQTENWHLYAPLLQNEMFKEMLIESEEEMKNVTKKVDGEIDLFGSKFTKI
jgi:hypothetical protein